MALIVSKQAPTTSAERWEDYDDDTKVLLRGLDDNEYKVALERARRRLQARDARFGEHDVGVLPGEESEHAIQCKLLGQFVIRDWKGVEDENKNNIEYSPEAAASALRDIEFFIWALKTSGEIAAEAKMERDETLGKSSSTTTGRASGASKARSKKPSQPDSE